MKSPTKQVLKNDMRRVCRAVLAERFGGRDPHQLTYFERQQAYEHCKKIARSAARRPKIYERKCQQIAEYLQV